jgi:molecular chaperone IbpA
VDREWRVGTRPSRWRSAGETPRLDIDPKSHPAWTGVQRIMDTGGQAAKFDKKFAGPGIRKQPATKPLETARKVTQFRRVRNAQMGFRGLTAGPAHTGGPNHGPCSLRRFNMTTFDFAPLFRTAIGFDRLARLVDNAAATADAPSYPPYNIEKTGDDTYRLTMAVAGFRPEEIDLVVKDNTLFVSGRVSNEAQKGEVLYRGIAGRASERRFVLADHIVVDGADLQNGLLHVGLKRVVPEALKPRRIAIGGGAPAGIEVPATIANDTTVAKAA